MRSKVTPWFVRLGVYTVVAATGLVLTVLGFVTPDTVDTWLAQVGSLSALIGGTLAIINTDKESDKPDNSVTVEELVARNERRELEEAEVRARNTLNEITSKVSRVESGEPIFSVFKK